RTARGAAAAQSHTAALAGADAVYDAVMRKYGVCRVETLESMLDVTYALFRSNGPVSGRLAVVTASGGVGAQVADFASAAGLDLDPLPETAAQRIKALSPMATTMNPVDVTGQFMNDHHLLEGCVRILLESGAYDT